MALTGPPKGSPAERQIWTRWARQNGLINSNGLFVTGIISDRRRVFRNGLTPKDTNLLDSIESVLINLFHFANAVTERWPQTVRVMLNTLGEHDKENHPFESWVGPPGLETRKQSTRVWTDLVQFLVLEYHVNNITWSDDGDTLYMKGESGYLTPMHLTISDDLGDDIMDIVQAHMMSGFGLGPGHLKSCVHDFCLHIVMQENATPKNNPLLFWVALLLRTEEFGDNQRLEFGGLRDELTMLEKLVAVVHYARVLILDYAFKSWLTSDSISEEWKVKLEKALNPADMGWSDDGLPRPVDQAGDPADFGEPYWRNFMAHFQDLWKKWLIKGSTGPVGVILELL